jgi:hypothetical protein
MPFRPLTDIKRIARARKRRPARFKLSDAASVLVLPLIGTGLFLALFAAANPLIGSALGDVDPFGFLAGWSPLRLIFWMLVGALVWRLLRPRLWLPGERSGPTTRVARPAGRQHDVGDDLADRVQHAVRDAERPRSRLLWSGTPLPDGMTLAEYAHRGAYPLIGTALLAGGFVLLTTRAGTEMARSNAIQRLVYLWLAQNIFLVSSTMLRTIDYIEVINSPSFESRRWSG